MDEDGEPLMDPDMPSDREASPEPADPIDDDDNEEDWRRDRSPTPVLVSMSEGKSGKPRKRLVKQSERESSPAPAFEDGGLDDWDGIEEPSSKKKSYILSGNKGNGGSGKKVKRKSLSSSSSIEDRLAGKGGKGSKGNSGGSSADPIMEEMWNTIAGNDSEVCLV